MAAKVTVEDVENYFVTLSNWGRWGADDQKGALNLITDEVRRAATASVRSGRAVSLARDIDPRTPDPLYSNATVRRETVVREVVHYTGSRARFDCFSDLIEISPHGGNAHLDAPSHYCWDDRYYNGFDAELTSEADGAVDVAASGATEGIITRGVLLDIAGLFGVDFVERGYAITYEDLLAAEQRQGVTVRSGDALLIHTGSGAALLEHGPLIDPAVTNGFNTVQSGLDAGALPFLKERDVAIMGSDGTHDVTPTQFSDFDFARPIHTVCLVAMGVWLMDNLDLTELAAACDERRQWDFLLTANPLRLVGATASPLNPVAVL